MADSRSSALLDDEGNLFGLVNVVDALAVLLVVAVIVAGAALVFQPEPDPPDPATTSVTVDLGPQPQYLVSEINEGDTYSPNGNSELTITDVYLTPQGDQTRVILRATLQGTANGDSLTYANAPPRLGRSLTITTSRYEVSGQIRAVGGDNSLNQENTTVVLKDTMAAAEAREVTSGDEIRLGGRTVATVEDVAAYATEDPSQQTVFIEAELETYTQQGSRRFGGTQVRRGQTVTLPAADYTIDGRIERVGALEPRGTLDNRTVTLRMTDIHEDMANVIEPGMTEVSRGETIARVSRVNTDPSVIITTGDNGSVTVVDHPFLRDVTITAELQVRETTSGVQFKGESVQQGSSVVINLGTLTIEADVVSVGT